MIAQLIESSLRLITKIDTEVTEIVQLVKERQYTPRFLGLQINVLCYLTP
jgi:hypothetical protein